MTHYTAELAKLNELLEPSSRTSLTKSGYSYLNLLKSIECKDGLKMSVQASQSHYCSPRNNKGPYTKVEIGYPSKAIPALVEYAEDAENLTDTVYGYVPITLVAKIIADHGGFK